jgi:signal transduction histidine kinase
MDLRDVVSRVVQELTSTMGQDRVRIDMDGDTHGRWDADRLAQVFSNLVANALEHSPEGAAVRVSVDASDGSRITVVVQNPGTIAPELLPELFEPFRKAGQQAKSRGLGLGLYITKQIVEAHGGTIDVSTSADAGTRFRVVLPRLSAS